MDRNHARTYNMTIWHIL